MAVNFNNTRDTQSKAAGDHCLKDMGLLSIYPNQVYLMQSKWHNVFLGGNHFENPPLSNYIVCFSLYLSPTHTHTLSLSLFLSLSLSLTLTHIHTYTHTLSLSLSHTHTHTHTHSHSLPHTHTEEHTHTLAVNRLVTAHLHLKTELWWKPMQIRQAHQISPRRRF